MKIEDYAPQEPLTEQGAGYKAVTLYLSSRVPAGEEFSYGDDPCQRLIVHPAAKPNGTVLAFTFGGGWTNGYKEMMSFMAPAMNAAGVTFVTFGYRLAPQHLFPVGWMDAARTLQWLHANVGRWGANPKRLFVGGHSAGAHYAALLATRRDWQAGLGLPADVVRGVLPISGIYWFGEGSGLSMRPRFLGSAEAGNDVAASPGMHLVPPPPPMLLAHGSEDFPHLSAQAERFERELAAAGGDAERIVLPGRNHFTACYAAGEADGPWAARAIAWLAAH
ncbi:MAG: alpha/beta hydrolase [Alphaproteobacteria bacterium]|nr:alpha/beta hydrolase [Alphaproteobacteria bacterium]